MRKSFIWVAALVLCLVACRRNNVTSVVATDSRVENVMRYAQNAIVIKTDKGSYVEVKDPWHEGKALGKFLLVNDSVALSMPDRIGDTTIIVTPVQSVVSFSSTQWSVFLQLGEIDRIKCVLEGRYAHNPTMRDLLASGKIADVGTEQAADMEKIIAAQPDIMLYSPYFDQSNDAMKRVGATMFPYADYIENTPLGRAEWIRIVGLLTAQQDKADAWFDEIERRYNALNSLCADVEERPTVFSDLAFNGQWYVAGGNSYIAKLFADAGADYVWKDNESAASFPLDAETILMKAQHADFWRVTNSAESPMTYASLAAQDSKYTLFDAYKNHKIIVCDIIPTGYFEQSQLEPDILLADFIHFFHPEMLTGEWEGYEPKYYHLVKE